MHGVTHNCLTPLVPVTGVQARAEGGQDCQLWHCVGALACLHCSSTVVLEHKVLCVLHGAPTCALDAPTWQVWHGALTPGP